MKNRLTNQLAILVSWYPCDAIISLAIYTHNSNDQCEFIHPYKANKIENSFGGLSAACLS